jgi:hypothetical protein
MAGRKGLLLDQSGGVASALDALKLTDWDFQAASTLAAANKVLDAVPSSFDSATTEILFHPSVSVVVA